MSMELNPKLEKGDRVVLIVMSDPYSPITVGTKGTVVKVSGDPWSNEPIYQVDWDNGRFNNLIGDEDMWVKDKKENISESTSKMIDNSCNTLGEGKIFCNTLAKILSTGRGGTGSKTLRNNAIGFFKKLIEDDFFSFGDTVILKPGNPHFDLRLKELNDFYNILSNKDSCSRMRNKVKEDIENVKGKGLKMIIDSDENYSILNRVDTHYTTRAYILTSAYLDLMQDTDENIDDYNTSEVISAAEETIQFDKNIKDFDSDSLRHVDRTIKSLLSNEQTKNIILNDLERTRSMGNQVESEAIKALENDKFSVTGFSNDFGFVDHFGVDMLAEKNGRLYPIQVSSSRKIQPKLMDYQDSDCDCMAVYKGINGKFRIERMLNENKKGLGQILKNRTLNESFIDEIKPLLPILEMDDGNYIFDFLKALRDSGIVNMLQSPDFTWSGREFLEKYLMIQELKDSYQQIEDEDEKENLLGLAEKSQQVMVSAAFKNLQDKEQELSTSNINRELRKLGPLALKYFMMKL